MKTIPILCLCVLSIALVPVYAQEPGAAMLAGRVVDPSNAGVPGLAVRARNLDIRQTFTATTDHQGNYTFPALRPGRYSICVEAAGFGPYAREGLVLSAGQSATANITLHIRPVSEHVTVTAKAPALESVLETQTWNFQEVIEIWQARQSSARDVGEALTKIDGLWKIRKGGIANDVVLRGFQQDNINVLVDGLRIYGACPNNMDPPVFHIDFAEIKEVEVTKGAFSVRDQGSLGGVVNIITKTPSPGLHVTPSFSTGSFGYYNPSVTASLSKKRFHGLAGYSFRTSQPYVDGRGKRFTDYANYRSILPDATAFDIGTSWFKFGAAPWENHRLELGYTRQRGDQVLYPYLLMDAAYDDADRLSASYHISNLSGLVKHVRMQSYFTNVKHLMNDARRQSSVGTTRPYGMQTFAETKALGGRLEAELADFTTGFEGYRRNWNVVNTMLMAGMYMNQPSIPDVLMSVAGLYGEYRRLFVNKLWFNAGARLDIAKSEARSPLLNTDLFWAYKGTRNLSRTDTNPSASAWLAYSLGKGFELFSGLGHTVRLPDPQERFFALKRMGSDWVGNPNLQPTQNTEVDLGINYRNRRFSLKPTVFYSHLENYLTVHNQARVNSVPSVMNASARSYENVQAKLYGGELVYSVGLNRALLFLGGLSYSRGTKEPKPASRIFARNLAEIPPLRSRAALRYGNKFFFGEIESVAVKAQNKVDSDLGELRTPGYAVINLRVGVHTTRLNLAAGVENLLNRYYYEHFSYQRDPFRLGAKIPEPGRSVFLTVAYAF